MKFSETHSRTLRLVMQAAFTLMLWGSVIGAVCLSREYAEKREAAEMRRETKKIFQAILPSFDNEPWQDRIRAGGQEFFVARCVKAPSLSPEVAALTADPAVQKLTEPDEQPCGFVFLYQQEGWKFFTALDTWGNITGIFPLTFPRGHGALAEWTKSPGFALKIKDMLRAAPGHPQIAHFMEQIQRARADFLDKRPELMMNALVQGYEL